MRRLTSMLGSWTRRVGRAAASAQGVAGVACVGGGTYLVAGPGWALIVVGLFLLLGAWATR